MEKLPYYPVPMPTNQISLESLDRPSFYRVHNPRLFWGCLALHTVLVLFHVALVVIFFGRFEQQTLVSQARGPLVSVVVVVIAQVFITLYAAALVYCVQRLAFRRNLHLPQSLSALHDTTTAWNGLGTALLSLIRQYNVHTTVIGVLTVVMYLTAISVQHITTPALFSFVAVNVSVPLLVATSPSRPDLIPPWSNYSVVFTNSMLSLPGSTFDNPSYQLGLEGNILYDVLADNSGIGSALVNASRIQVQCGLLSTNSTTFSHTFREWYWNIDTDAGELEVFPGDPGTIYLRPAPDGNLTTIIVMAYINITDSLGYSPPSLPVIINSAELIPDTFPTAPSGPNYTYPVQLAACNLAVANQTVYVDSQHKTMLSSPKQEGTSLWQSWNRTQGFQSENTDPLVLAWPTLFTTAESATTGQVTFDEATGDPTELTYLEQALLESLSVLSALQTEATTIESEDPGIQTGVNSNATKPVTVNVTLANLEIALANITSSVYWYGPRVAANVQTQPGEAYVHVYPIFYRLQLNETAVCAGLGTSLLLLVLSTYLTHQSGPRNRIPEDLHGSGVLHILWLAGRTPSVARRIFEYAPKPAVDALRAVGALELQLGSTVEPHVDVGQLQEYEKVSALSSIVKSPDEMRIHSAYALTPSLASEGRRDGHKHPVTTSRRHSQLATFALCLALHAGLVLIYIVLLVVYARRFEHNVTFSSNPAAVSTYIVVAAQFYTTILTTGLTFTTQQLALRRNLHVPQRLSILHDKISAWSGLGSALSTLRRQVELPSSVFGILSILLYLACIPIQHITTPALFTVVAFNSTQSVIVASSPSRPILTNPRDNWELYAADFLESTQALQAFQLDRDSSRLGLQGNIIYDVIDDNSGFGTTFVNSTTFHVTCCVSDPGPTRNSSTSWNFETAFGSVPLLPAYMNSLYLLVAQDNGTEVLMAAAYTNITDDVGNTPPSTPLVGSVPSSDSAPSVQVAPCSLEVRNGTVEVDVLNKTILNPPLRTKVSMWETCNATSFFTNQTDPLSQAWTAMFDYDDMYHSTTPWTPYFTPSFPGNPLSDVEVFVMNQLAISPSENLSSQFSQNISLSELELALENVTATLYWYMYFIIDNGTSTSNDETLVQVQSLSYRLNLNALPLFFGLASALSLLVLAIILAVPPKRDGLHEALDGAGLLQILWLSGRTPSVAQRISEHVSRPSIQALRIAGMQEPQLGFTVSERWDRGKDGFLLD